MLFIHAASEPHAPAERSTLAPRRKRALFRAWHRGTRELDLVMGRFADRELGTLGDDELAIFERLLDEPEPEVADWVMERAAPPADYGPLLDRLRVFRT